MTRSFGFSGSLLGHAAALRLHVAREDWLPTGRGLPGATACITVLKHRLAAPDGQARVAIHFDDRGRTR
jgi:RecA/RadA recombinase